MAFWKNVGKFFKNYGAPILSAVFPIGGALLGSFLQGKEANKAVREQERIQQETERRQQAILSAQEAKDAAKTASEQERMRFQRRSLLRRGGRRQTLFASPLGVTGEQPIGQRSTLG